jgi:hypothetical protein
MPSRPMRQTCLNTVGPSPVRCSTNWIERPLGLAEQLGEDALARKQRQVAQVVAVQLNQVEGEQHSFMSPALDAQRAEVRRPVLAGDHRLAVDQERCSLDAERGGGDGPAAVLPVMAVASEAADIRQRCSRASGADRQSREIGPRHGGQGRHVARVPVRGSQRLTETDLR